MVDDIAKTGVAAQELTQFVERVERLSEAIDQTDDQPLRNASNTQNPTTTTARRIIRLVLMSHVTLQTQV